LPEYAWSRIAKLHATLLGLEVEKEEDGDGGDMELDEDLVNIDPNLVGEADRNQVSKRRTAS
jgi:hypothetical protein